MRPTGIWMPLYVGDYLADTTHLTTLEHGAYLLLLMAYWRRGSALPNDDKYLQRITNLHGNSWRYAKKNIIHFFEEIDGNLYHKRMEKEILKASERSAAGVRANSVRWSGRTPNHLHSHIHKESKKDKSSPSVPKSDWPSGYFNEFYDAYPRKVGKGDALKALTALYKSGDVPWAVFMAGVHAYAAYAKTQDIKFIKHPGPWIRGRRWEDQLTEGEFKNGSRGPRPLQDDSRSASRAADRLIEAAERGEFSFGPRPNLLPEGGESPLRLLPKG